MPKAAGQPCTGSASGRWRPMNMTAPRACFSSSWISVMRSTDTAADIDAAIRLGDILRREGDLAAAQSYFRRAARSAPRVEYPRGVAEALIGQIEFYNDAGDSDTVIQLQKQALEGQHGGRRTLGCSRGSFCRWPNHSPERGGSMRSSSSSRIGVEISREIGDLTAEGECLEALVEAYRQRGDMIGVAAGRASCCSSRNGPAAGPMRRSGRSGWGRR